MHEADVHEVFRLTVKYMVPWLGVKIGGGGYIKPHNLINLIFFPVQSELWEI